jgi:hypothetical protein
MKQDDWLLFDRLPAAEVICSRAYGPLEEIELPDAGEVKLNIGDYVPPLEARNWASPGWVGKRVFMATAIRMIPGIMDEVVERYRDCLLVHADWLLSSFAAVNEWGPDLPTRTLSVAWEYARALPEPQVPATDSQKNAECLLNWMTKWHLGDPEHPDLALIAWDEAQWRFADSVRASHVSRRKLAEVWAKLKFYDCMADPKAPQLLRPRMLTDLPHEWSIAIPAWLPTLETRESYESRAREAFDQYLREDRELWTRDAEDAGLVPTATKRNGTLHFKWLARYQVIGESYAAIAESNCVDYKTVSEGVKRTAEAIDLPLRPPGRPGRKPNSA